MPLLPSAYNMINDIGRQQGEKRGNGKKGKYAVRRSVIGLCSHNQMPRRRGVLSQDLKLASESASHTVCKEGRQFQA